MASPAIYNAGPFQVQCDLCNKAIASTLPLLPSGSYHPGDHSALLTTSQTSICGGVLKIEWSTGGVPPS